MFFGEVSTNQEPVSIGHDRGAIFYKGWGQIRGQKKNIQRRGPGQGRKIFQTATAAGAGMIKSTVKWGRGRGGGSKILRFFNLKIGVSLSKFIIIFVSDPAGRHMQSDRIKAMSRFWWYYFNLYKSLHIFPHTPPMLSIFFYFYLTFCAGGRDKHFRLNWNGTNFASYETQFR